MFSGIKIYSMISYKENDGQNNFWQDKKRSVIWWMWRIIQFMYCRTTAIKQRIRKLCVMYPIVCLYLGASDLFRLLYRMFKNKKGGAATTWLNHRIYPTSWDWMIEHSHALKLSSVCVRACVCVRVCVCSLGSTTSNVYFLCIADY